MLVLAGQDVARPRSRPRLRISTCSQRPAYVQPYPLGTKPFSSCDEVLERSAQPVEAPDHQRIAGAQVRERLLKIRSLGRATGCVFEDPFAPGLIQRVALRVERLGRRWRRARSRSASVRVWKLIVGSVDHIMISGRDFQTLHVLVLPCLACRLVAVWKPSVCQILSAVGVLPARFARSVAGSFNRLARSRQIEPHVQCGPVHGIDAPKSA